MQPWSQPLLWPAPGGAVACDPYFGNVVLLMGYEGAQGATSGPGMTDESPSAHGVATVQGGSVSITQTQKKFGVGSLTLGGASSIDYASSTDWNLGSGQFTIETWIFPALLSAVQAIVCQQSASAGNYGWLLELNNNTP